MQDPSFEGFVWSVGEEGSDPVVTGERGDIRHDQYESSGHYDHMESDLSAIANLGVRIVRYGMPWRLAEPQPGVYDWTLWDRAFAGLEKAGLVPVIDLLHFGLPDHAGSFIDPRWVDRFCSYAERFLDRYREPSWFTPVNEPGVTALLTGRFGMWNDRRASREDHAKILANLVLANLEVLARVRSDRDGWWIGSEGFDAWVDPTGLNSNLVEQRRAASWLVWDLHFGREPLPWARGYLDPVDDHIRDRIAALSIADRTVAGHDFYPSSVRSVDASATPNWTIEDRVNIGIDELKLWHDRYGVPLWISETSNLSLPLADQEAWLLALTEGLRRLAADGVPVRGLCWYSRGDQFDWDTLLVHPTGTVTEVGLYDAARNRRPIADVFTALVSRGAP